MEKKDSNALGDQKAPGDIHPAAAPATLVDSDCPLTLPEVLREELGHIRQNSAAKLKHRKTKRETKKQKEADSHLQIEDEEDILPTPCTKSKVEDLNDVFSDFHESRLSALCLSGGGIRSATFALGVVEALAERRLLPCFDYLSTVSGGGYLGTWLSGWIRREQQYHDEVTLGMAGVPLWQAYQEQDSFGVKAVQTKINDKSADRGTQFDPATEPKQMQFLREYSNYMTPRVGLLSADTWTFASIYLRNLFLNWTIFLPLLGVLMLLPRLMDSVIQHAIPGTGWLWAGVIAIFVCTALTLGTVIACLPSGGPDPNDRKWCTDQWILIRAVLPLVATVIIASILVGWSVDKPEAFRFLRFKQLGLWYLIGIPSATYVVLKLIIGGTRSARVLRESKRLSYIAVLKSLGFVRTVWVAVIAVMCTTLGNFLIAYIYGKADRALILGTLYPTFAVPLMLLLFLLTATVFVGLASKWESDGDREWFARFGAWVLIVCLAWIFVCGTSFWGPGALEWIGGGIWSLYNSSADKVSGGGLWAVLTAIGGAISGAVSLIGGFSGKSKARPGAQNTKYQMFLAGAPQVAAVVFFLFIFAGVALLAETIGKDVGDRLISFVRAGDSQGVLWNAAQWLVPFRDKDGAEWTIRFTVAFTALLSFISIGMSLFLNTNKFSLHGAYRDRLIRAYLGASKVKRKADPFTGFDERDNFQLHRLKGQRPFHVINGTLNLVDGEKLAWQNRKAASFIMTPLHCGSWASEGFRNTFEYGRNWNLDPCGNLGACNKQGSPCKSVTSCEYRGKSLRIGTAMTISGAAVNPNMGYHSSPVVMFLMALFNIRLGWWLGNTNRQGGEKKWFQRYRYYQKAGPAISILPLLSETFGRTDKDRRFINLSDGGHFDNLGIYEMVMRRCRFLVVSDASADDTFAFDDLARAIDLCEVDLGVKIVFKGGIDMEKRVLAVKKRRLSRKQKEVSNLRWAIAEIRYPEARDANGNPDPTKYGYLLYVKPSYQGDEPIELKHYAEAHPTFPHQSTVDQLFDEQQFEAYRELGALTMREVFDASDTIGRAKGQDGSSKPLKGGERRSKPKNINDPDEAEKCRMRDIFLNDMITGLEAGCPDRLNVRETGVPQADVVAEECEDSEPANEDEKVDAV